MLVNNVNDFSENFLSKLNVGSHILYIFNNIDKYIDNAINFILEGLLNDDVILFVDTKESFTNIKNELKRRGYNSIQLENLLFADSTDTYIENGEFSLCKAGNLINILNPYFEKGYRIRTWGQVLLADHETTLERIRITECNSDDFISKSNLTSVCAYNGLTLPAYLQNELMRTHTHLMTDSEYILSPLYDRNYLQIPTMEEKKQLRQLAKQNKELIDKNNQLANEKKLISMKNKLINESEQQLRAIIEQLPNPIIIRRDTRLLFINDIAKEKFMITSQKIDIDHHLSHLFEEYDRNSISLEENQIQNHDFILDNGKKMYSIVKSIELLFEGESSILHSFIDISQEKENERLIVRSEKMNIAGQLAASIAHEIRNPLTAVKGFFQMIKQDRNENELYYTVIDDELSRIEQITSELLTLAKPHSENRRIHNIIQLIDEVKLLLTSQANSKNIEIIPRAIKSEINISCEVTKIKQVFINLIKNAIDAMESGGKVILNINESDNNIVVQVIDQGTGIPNGILERIGEPFYTTKEKGTGIGLMVCYQIIESHEGTIEVESDNGLGTTFTITLPVFKDKVPV